MATVKKFLKNIELIPVGARTEATLIEKILLESFLPKQMTLDELTFEIDKCIASSPGIQMGAIMAHLKNTFEGKYDAGLASKIIKAKLTK